MLPYTPDWSHVSTSNGYRVVRCPGHPRAWKHGSYVYVHIVVAEMRLGRLLGPDEVAHHKNEDKFDNCPDNIVVMDKRLHAKLHRPKAQTKLLTCAFCGKAFIREERRIRYSGGKNQYCGYRCNGMANGYGERPIRHGTRTGYGRGCRCLECREANSLAMRKYRSRKIKTP
jgi:hypothetical protein